MKNFDKQIVPNLSKNKLALGFTKTKIVDEYRTKINPDLAYGTQNKTGSQDQTTEEIKNALDRQEKNKKKNARKKR